MGGASSPWAVSTEVRVAMGKGPWEPGVTKVLWGLSRDWRWLRPGLFTRLSSVSQGSVGLGAFPVYSVRLPLASQLPQHEAGVGVGGQCRRSARELVARRQLPEQPHPFHLHVFRAAP